MAGSGPVEGWMEKSEFEDHLPVMAEKLGTKALLEELCRGFRLLADEETGLITFASLKRNAAALGLEDLSDSELMGMLREGDINGDDAMDEMEFCVLMFRLSPELIAQSRRILDEALSLDELTGDSSFFFS